MWSMDPKKIFFSNSCAVVLTPFFNKPVFNLMVWDDTLLISKVNLVLFLNFQSCSRSTHLCMPHCFSYRRFRVYLYLTRFCVCVCVCAQFCPTFCNPMNCSPLGSSVHGIFQTRTLEWVAISFSRESSWSRDQTWGFCVSCIGGRILYQLYHLGSHLVRLSLLIDSSLPPGSHICMCIHFSIQTSIWPSNPTAGHTHQGNQNWKRRVYHSVHRSTVYNSQDMEAN